MLRPDVSRLTADFLSLGRFLNFDSAEPRRVCIQRLCIFYPIFGLLLYCGFRDPRAMVIFGGFFQAATLPVISAAAVYLRYRRTDRRIAPSMLSDVCLWLAFLSITIVAGYAIRDWGLTQLWPAVREKFGG